jgi:hypothetical protein
MIIRKYLASNTPKDFWINRNCHIYVNYPFLVKDSELSCSLFIFLSVKGIVLQVCCQRQIVGYKIPDDWIKGRTLGTGARGSGKICKLVCCTITISFNKSDRMILEGLE